MKETRQGLLMGNMETGEWGEMVINRYAMIISHFDFGDIGWPTPFVLLTIAVLHTHTDMHVYVYVCIHTYVCMHAYICTRVCV